MVPDRHFHFRDALPLVFALLLVGCGAGQQLVPPVSPGAGPVVLDAGEIAELIPVRYKERRPWGEAISSALAANEFIADKPSVCAVIALIAQESGFEADPVVPGMAKVVG